MLSIKNIRLSDQAIDSIKQMITEKGFKPGDRFFSENELTKMLEVSRSSIREAVRILEATGYVSVRQGKGIFIAESLQNELEAFRSWLGSNSEAVFDHYEVRLIIDPRAALYSAGRVDADDIHSLEKLCTEFENALRYDSSSGMIKADEMFHLKIAEFSGNRTLFFLMKTMTGTLPDGWISSIYIPLRAAATAEEHRMIFEYIKNGDGGKAEKAMKEHLENAIKDIRNFYDAND